MARWSALRLLSIRSMPVWMSTRVSLLGSPSLSASDSEILWAFCLSSRRRRLTAAMPRSVIQMRGTTPTISVQEPWINLQRKVKTMEKLQQVNFVVQKYKVLEPYSQSTTFTCGSCRGCTGTGESLHRSNPQTFRHPYGAASYSNSCVDTLISAPSMRCCG